MYHSKTIRNELIGCCGEILTKKIIDEARKAKFFSILADRASDCSNKEQRVIVIEFVDDQSNIREDFLGFFRCKEGTKGFQIASLLMETASKLKLEMENC